MALVNLSAYAKIRGVSPATVTRAVQAGRITLTADRKVDVDLANQQWAAFTDPAQQRRGSAKDFAKTQAMAHESASKTANGAAILPSRFLLDEKTRTEGWRAKMAEMDYRQRVGELIDKAAVEAAWATRLMAAAEALQAIPDRIAAALAAEVDANECHRALAAEIRAAMARLSTPAGAVH